MRTVQISLYYSIILYQKTEEYYNVPYFLFVKRPPPFFPLQIILLFKSWEMYRSLFLSFFLFNNNNKKSELMWQVWHCISVYVNKNTLTCRNADILQIFILFSIFSFCLQTGNPGNIVKGKNWISFRLTDKPSAKFGYYIIYKQKPFVMSFHFLSSPFTMNYI